MSPQTAPDTPAFTHSAYDSMNERWTLCRRVYNGTEAMREFYMDHFWQSPAESGDEFKKRCQKAEMFPAFKQTVDGLTGVAFRVEPRLAEDVPKVMVDMAENIDGQGTHLVVFLKELFRDMLRDGHQGILIDAPPVVTDESGKPKRLTRGQEQRQGVRPYWIQIFPDNILSFRLAVLNGVVILSQIVLKETSEEPQGMFSNIEVTRYRKYKREQDGTVTYRVWTQQMVDTWNDTSYNTPEVQGVVTNQTEIPFVAAYAGPKLAALISKPPLLDLAFMNVAHMNVVSDRRNGLHAAMHPILVFKGRRQRAQDVAKAKSEGKDDSQLIGPFVGIDLPPDANADVFYAEHAGTALGEGRNEIKDIEMRMASMGLAMLQNDTRAAETAEAKRIDKDEKTANLSSAVRSLQDAAELAMAFTANFLRQSSGGSLVVSKQFEAKPMDAALISALSNMVGNGQLSLETMWAIMITMDALPEGLNFEEEILRIAKSGMKPGIGIEPPPEPEPTGGAKRETGAGGPAA